YSLLLVRCLPSSLSPPSPLLFPYTTLFRSRRSVGLAHASRRARGRRAPCAVSPRWRASIKLGGLIGCRAFHDGQHPNREARGGRSEEHTSELQSRFDLVCRLLPVKKKWSSD